MDNFNVAETGLATGTTLIEASAGTGKTYTITGIVVRLIAQHGIPIQQILITTYTEAATAELRERVRGKIELALKALETGSSNDALITALLPNLDAEKARPALQDALRDYDEAAIHTIHSFCSRVLREHAFETGATFDARLIEDENMLRLECAQDFWRQHFYETPAVIVAAALAGKLSPEKLVSILNEVASHPEAEIRPAAERLGILKEMMSGLLVEFREQWPLWRESVHTLFTSANAWANKPMKEATVSPALAALELLMERDDVPVSAYEALKYFTQEAVLNGTSKRSKSGSPSHSFFEFCSRYSMAGEDLCETIPAHFVAWARKELPLRKRAHGVISYDDLLRKLHAALEGDGGKLLAERLASRFQAALVDEFQDTDPVQAAIFRRVFARDDRFLFLIGDPKQAIYRFRGADVFAYLDVKQWADRVYSLGENQRSVAKLVDAVNTLFERQAAPFIDKRIEFHPVKAAGRKDAEPLLFDGVARAPMRFQFLESEEPVRKTHAARLIPDLVASSLLHLLQSGATIGTGENQRAVTPGDCAVLCRANRHAQAIQQALAARCIPAVVLSNSNVMKSPEARDLDLILTSLVESKREDFLRAAIGTVTLGMTAHDVDLLQSDAAGWDALCSRWREYHKRWVEGGFIRMFAEFMRAEKIRQRLLSLQDGERRVTNLQHLAELLHAAADKEHLTPVTLLQWFKHQASENKGVKEWEMRLDRDDSAVNVVTIHKSKGLEYPIVFCPFLWNGFSRDGKKPLRFHNEASGMVYDLRKELDGADIIRAENQEFAEDARLLYVALTRAEYECHVVWGRFEDGKTHKAEISPLLHLLETERDGACDIESLRTAGGNLNGAKLYETVSTLAGNAPDVFAVEPLIERDGTLSLQTSPTDSLHSPRTFTGRIDRSWRVSSFSSLIAGAETVEADRDGDSSAPVPEVMVTGIHAFPRGIKAGVCLHEIFEELEFSNAAGIAPLVEKKLEAYGFHQAQFQSAVSEMIAHTLKVDLMGGENLGDAIRLETMDRTHALPELEFYFPTGRLEPAQLSGFANAGLTFEPRAGILKGFIDLVFEQNGRFHIADWKSNWLGPDAESYGQESMAAAMKHHHYQLQSHLYAFALHRYLRSRLRDYNPTKHLGEVFYLFIRGIDPARPEMGVYRATPPFEAIEQMERVFGGTP